MDFGDLKDDKAIQEKLLNFHESVNKLDTILEVAFSNSIPENKGLVDQVNFDLFTSYCLNTLYWLYLRSKGLDPNEDDVKKELGRIKEYMMKAKIATERHTKRMKLDTEAAGRFVKHGINYKKKRSIEPNQEDKVEEVEAKKRKI